MRGYKQLSLLAAIIVCGGALASSKDEQSIHHVYAKLVTAMKDKSVSEVAALEAPGFTDTENGKTMKADEANNMMKQEFALVKFSIFDIKVTSVKVSGATATATTSFRFTGKVVVGSKPHTLEATGTTSDTLVKTSKGWLFQTTKDTGQKVKMDGKTVQAGAM